MSAVIAATGTLTGGSVSTYTVTIGVGTWTGVTYHGYANAIYSVAGNDNGGVGFGSITPTTFKGANISGLYWTGSAGTFSLELRGNRASTITLQTFTVNGVLVGTNITGSYNSGINVTVYTTASGKTDPGTTGTFTASIA